jgi:mannose-1-phosphate guanylyltransferase/phosphomannomutase
VKMAYATEETPLGTAGSVRNAMEHLTERFVVISGDVLTDIDLGAIIDFHDRKGAMATIGLAHVDNPLEFGIVITHEDGSIERFLEKPTWGQVFSDTINTGIFVLEPEIFDYIEADRPVDFSGEVFPRLLEEGQPLFGAIAEGYWEDVGTLEAYVRAHKDILDAKVEVAIPGFEIRPGVWVGESADIHPEATITGPAVIGDNCRVEPGATIGEYSVLGSNVRVRNDAFLERTVVNDNAYLGDGVRLRGTVVGRSCDLRSGVRTEECTRSRPSRPEQWSTSRSSGSRGAPGASSEPRACRAWPTSTSPRSSPSGSPWPTAARSRRARWSSPRATRAARLAC